MRGRKPEAPLGRVKFEVPADIQGLTLATEPTSVGGGSGMEICRESTAYE